MLAASPPTELALLASIFRFLIQDRVLPDPGKRKRQRRFCLCPMPLWGKPDARILLSLPAHVKNRCSIFLGVSFLCCLPCGSPSTEGMLSHGRTHCSGPFCLLCAWFRKDLPGGSCPLTAYFSLTCFPVMCSGTSSRTAARERVSESTFSTASGSG